MLGHAEPSSTDTEGQTDEESILKEARLKDPGGSRKRKRIAQDE